MNNTITSTTTTLLNTTDLSDSLAHSFDGPNQYRFSGYQLPKVSLDETGPSNYVVKPHPYFYNQPDEWTKPAYINNNLIENNPSIINNELANSPPIFISSDQNNANNPINQENTTNLYRLSDF